jgi:hypothetical protein
VDARHAYLVICGVGIALAFLDTLTILALASRAFAFYYTLQCFVAVSVCQSAIQKFGMIVTAGMLLFIALFAVPAG